MDIFKGFYDKFFANDIMGYIIPGLIIIGSFNYLFVLLGLEFYNILPQKIEENTTFSVLLYVVGAYIITHFLRYFIVRLNWFKYRYQLKMLLSNGGELSSYKIELLDRLKKLGLVKSNFEIFESCLKNNKCSKNGILCINKPIKNLKNKKCQFDITNILYGILWQHSEKETNNNRIHYRYNVLEVFYQDLFSSFLIAAVVFSITLILKFEYQILFIVVCFFVFSIVFLLKARDVTIVHLKIMIQSFLVS